ncbi:MAG TPA: type II toxin-antitoxin system HicB family antitoxin [Thermoplasmata archaeon]|nr:type II toxin-antitoxin system HicB family antitoxin [Thermoplasmata archaeon]
MSEEMAGKTYHVVVEKDEDGWFVGSVPELPGCHTQGKTVRELMDRMREAIELYLETKGSDEPHPSFVAVETIEV